MAAELYHQVKGGIDPSFHNNRAFLQRIDALPEGPKWDCYPFELVGDEVGSDGKPKTETLEIWYRDPVECVRELLGNPAFTKQAYEPCRIFKKEKFRNREFNEMWTSDWWWEIQVCSAAKQIGLDAHNVIGTPSNWCYARADNPVFR